MLKILNLLSLLKQQIPEHPAQSHHIKLNDGTLQIMVMGTKGPLSVLIPHSEFSTSTKKIINEIKKLYSAL